MKITPRKACYFPDSDGVQQAAETVAGQSFAEFFHDYVAGVRELAVQRLLRVCRPAAGGDNLDPLQRQASTTASNLGSPPEVTSVVPNSEAQRAGIVVGDRVVEMNGRPATGQVDDQISRMRQGATVKIRVANRSGQRNVKLKLTSPQRTGVHSSGRAVRHPRTTRPSGSLDPWRR